MAEVAQDERNQFHCRFLPEVANYYLAEYGIMQPIISTK
jgi:hypothetical protein